MPDISQIPATASRSPPDALLSAACDWPRGFPQRLGIRKDARNMPYNEVVRNNNYDIVGRSDLQWKTANLAHKLKELF